MPERDEEKDVQNSKLSVSDTNVRSPSDVPTPSGSPDPKTSRRGYLLAAGAGMLPTTSVGIARATGRLRRVQGNPTVSRIAFRFQDNGGNNNLEVNGDRREVDGLGELANRTVGGADVMVATAAASDGEKQEPEAIVTGSISSFSVGGAEFVLDSLEIGPSNVPRATVEFDSVTPAQSTYGVGDDFDADGISFSIDSYIYPTGRETERGTGQISNGSDPEFQTGNANLRVDIGSVPGGNLSLTLTDDTATAGGEAVVDFVLTNEGRTETASLQGIVNRPSNTWALVEEPAGFTTLEPGESETIPVRFEVPLDAAGEYTFSGLVESEAGNEATDTATVTVTRPAREIEATDLRLLQSAEHTRPKGYQDTVTRSALEAEDAIPEWSPDPDPVVGKPTVPIFDIEFVDEDIDVEPETEVPIDVTVRWESAELSEHSFTVPPNRVDAFLSGENPDVSSFTDLLVNFGVDDTYPVVELSSDVSGYEVELEPQGESLSGTTTTHTGVSTVEIPPLNVAFVQLTDTEDNTDYEPIEQTLAGSEYDFNDVVEASVQQVEYLFPTSSVNSEIYTEPVALESNNPRTADPAYRQRQQENAWDFARAESDRELDVVVAFCPSDFIGDHHTATDSAKGMVTSGACAQAALVDVENGPLLDLKSSDPPTTAAHEMTHYFIWDYTSGEEYGIDDTHMSGDQDEGTTVVSTVATLPTDAEVIPASGDGSSSSVADYFRTPVSYMVGGRPGGADTITYRELLAVARENGFDCAWEWEASPLADRIDDEPVISIAATLEGDDLEVRSVRRRDEAAPADPPDADGEATVRNANGDAIVSVGLKTPPTGVRTDTDCCATVAAAAQSGEARVLRGRVPFPESAASIDLAASVSAGSSDEATASLTPTTATLREELFALPEEIFGGDPEPIRETMLAALAAANEEMAASEYSAALETFQSLRSTAVDELDESYEPAAPNLPTWSEVVAEIDDRIARVERLFETHRTETATESAADGTGLGVGGGLLGIAGARYVVDRLSDGDD
jgi:hypothetical protein